MYWLDNDCSDYRGLPRIGAVYIYILKSSTWTLSASFVSPSTYLNTSYGYATDQSLYLQSYFGANVAVFGNYAIVGAPYFSTYNADDSLLLIVLYCIPFELSCAPLVLMPYS